MNIKEGLKNLKEIKADNDFKIALRSKMLDKIGGGILTTQSQPISIWQAIFMKKAVLIPLVLIIAILGTGIGGAYASQSALPGDLLYPMKTATEKARVVLAINKNKKSELQIRFAERRLEEAEKLAEKFAEKKMQKPELIKSAIERYEKELSKSEKPLPEEAIIRRQKMLDKIEEKTKDYNSGVKESIKKAKGKTKR